jgi:hypothetical protein
MGFRLDYGKLIQTIHQSCLLEFQALFYTAQFGAMMHQGQWREKNYKLWIIEIHGSLKGGHCAKFHM